MLSLVWKKKLDIVSLLSCFFTFFMTSPYLAYADATRIHRQKSTARHIDNDSSPDDKLNTRTIEKFISLESRPTFSYDVGEAHTENSVEYGLQLYNRTKVSYVQTFSTNLYQPKTKKSVFKVPYVRLYDGYVKAKFSELWKSTDEKSKLSLQVRSYLPTNSATESSYSRYEQGMIMTLRTYLTLETMFSESVKGVFSVVPAVFFARNSGYTFNDKKFARETFETQLVSKLNFKLPSELEFEFPMILQMTKFSKFDTAAKLDDTWRANLSIEPELDWAYTKGQTAGIAFISSSLITEDFKSEQFDKAFHKGKVQLIWNIKF